MTKIDEIKSKIQQLVEKYEFAKKAGRLKSYTEEETKKDFILPLFQVLGWDVDNKNEVSAEEKISGDRVDYGFYIDGRIKFYLEAKKLEADLHKKEYARQAIKYSWNKGVTWAVLTDFEGIKVFNTQDAKASLNSKLLFSIPYDKYIEQFDELYLLSKESFKDGLIDTYAERIGKKFEKIPVSELLYKDLNWCRTKLTESLKNWNQKFSKNLIDEGVQKLLDRLIFLRVAEDRGIEKPTLIPLLREWEASKARNKTSIYASMIKKFRELDEVYNSNLFTEHPFEKWEEYSGETEKVIQKLYGEAGYYEYDFKVMPADVLGSVYENYLGYKLSQSKKGIEVHKDAKKRKEQGIYYTPHFIVEYIVKNALGPILDECKNIEDLREIKVLDPACGSGSFLLEAFRLFVEKYKSFQCDDFYTRVQILTNNIYGVDLDMQAVEIARLNLLLAALSTREKLPLLAENIKCGNSLISGTDEELKKYFGKNFRDKKPFNWEEEFPEVFKLGGFDVVIGNPPYVRNRELDNSDKDFFKEKYITAIGQYDLYQLFFEQSLKLLKIDGFVGFITSNKYTITDYGKKLREYLLQNSKIISMVDVSNLNVFKDAATYPYIIVFKNSKENRNNIIIAYKPVSELNLIENEIKISQIKLSETESKAFILKEENPLLGKIESISEKLWDICAIKETIHTGNVRKKLIVDRKIDKDCKKLLAGKDCHRYWFKWSGKWVRYDKKLIDKENGEYGNLCEQNYFEKPKIFLRDISLHPEAVFDDKKYYSVNTLYSLQNNKNKNYNHFYLLSLINSSLIRFYFNQRFEDTHVAGGFLRFKKIYSSQIPIKRIDFSDAEEIALHNELFNLGKKITEFYKELQNNEECSNEYEKIRFKIKKIDKEIDEKVYKLYNLTPEEIKIIEGEK